ncbi:MAG: hypothetical protein HY263_02060 [Chloroflexi bacterium]|nr:hypothetical protein [Chloroflexota bacterium]
MADSANGSAPSDRVELNDRVFVLPHALALDLAAGGMIHRCLDCDPSGRDYHLDISYTFAQLLDAGATAWEPPGRPDRVALVRLPIFNEHHGSNRA